MAITETELNHLSQLAYLNCESDKQELMANLNSIMDFMDQLRKMDTSGIKPLFHPLDLAQRLRSDEILTEDCSAELKKLAPSFKDGYYQVPQFLDAGL